MAKKSRGRQKIPIKKMKNEVNLQVTFSKRRCGLFKKASEICTLCGVDMAIVVFSPGNKCYGFGHPSLQGIIDRYQAGSTDNTAADQQPAVNHGTLSYMDMQRKAINEQLNLKLDHMETELNTEKKLRKDADDELKGARIQSQWKGIGGCDHAELARLHAKVEEFRRRLRKEAERRMLMQNASPQPVQRFFCGAVPGAGGRPLRLRVDLSPSLVYRQCSSTLHRDLAWPECDCHFFNLLISVVETFSTLQINAIYKSEESKIITHQETFLYGFTRQPNTSSNRNLESIHDVESMRLMNNNKCINERDKVYRK